MTLHFIIHLCLENITFFRTILTADKILSYRYDIYSNQYTTCPLMQEFQNLKIKTDECMIMMLQTYRDFVIRQLYESQNSPKPPPGSVYIYICK